MNDDEGHIWKPLFTKTSIPNRMPPKTERDRKRYIAFKVHSPRLILRNEFKVAIKGKISDRNTLNRIKPWLTVFNDNEGILRCSHSAKDEAIELLNSIKVIGREKVGVRVETLGTSGTIKKAKRRYLDGAN